MKNHFGTSKFNFFIYLILSLYLKLFLNSFMGLAGNLNKETSLSQLFVSEWNVPHDNLRENCLFFFISERRPSVRLRVVPHFSSGTVERARKGNMRRGERKMRDYRQSKSPSFWTYALLSQRKTLIGSSMEICQHLSKTHQPPSTLDIYTIYRTNN